jgi:D-aspartate ligase
VPDAPSDGALVLGASYRSLGVLRSLGRRGIAVWLLRDERHTIADHSRYARAVLPWPALEDEAAQTDHLVELAEHHQLEGWTLIPTDDETAALVSRAHSRLSEHYRVGVPAWESMRWAYDKRLTYRLGCDLGLDQPRTWLAGEAGFEEADVAFPAILKPAFKRERNRFTTEKAWPVADRAALERAFNEACRLVAREEILLQELIPGDARSQLSYAALAHDGHVLAWLTACRARQYPMDFGRESTYVYTAEIADIEAASIALVAEMRFTGLVEVEFKRDASDGKAKLLDINPRVWGWQSLGARAGVDFVDLLWRLLHGEAFEPVRGRVGVGWVRGSTDAATCAREMIGGRLSPRSYLESFRGPRERAMFALDDPLPGVLDAPLLMIRRFGR